MKTTQRERERERERGSCTLSKELCEGDNTGLSEWNDTSWVVRRRDRNKILSLHS
jgi:hypothetical protein